MFQPLIVCADIGSIAKGNFAWWSSDHVGGGNASSLAKHVSNSLNSKTPVALGFECPLYVPLGIDEGRLTSARPGEGSRPWSAGAGSGSLATGLVQVAWILREIRKNIETEVLSYLDWEQFVESKSGLLLWEAFVSAGTKRGSHLEDAKAAVHAFELALPNPTDFDMLSCTTEVYSLAGAALLRAGWRKDITVLSEKTLVIGPSKSAA